MHTFCNNGQFKNIRICVKLCYKFIFKGFLKIQQTFKLDQNLTYNSNYFLLLYF